MYRLPIFWVYFGYLGYFGWIDRITLFISISDLGTVVQRRIFVADIQDKTDPALAAFSRLYEHLRLVSENPVFFLKRTVSRDFLTLFLLQSTLSMSLVNQEKKPFKILLAEIFQTKVNFSC